jgi:hypothetical protein
MSRRRKETRDKIFYKNLESVTGRKLVTWVVASRP